jgi:hypothetical protein
MVLAKLLKKRGKKDFAIRLNYKARPGRAYAPYGPKGPAVFGFGKNFFGGGGGGGGSGSSYGAAGSYGSGYGGDSYGAYGGNSYRGGNGYGASGGGSYGKHVLFIPIINAYICYVCLN